MCSNERYIRPLASNIAPLEFDEQMSYSSPLADVKAGPYIVKVLPDPV
jgi:hypothetical protein